MITRWFHSALIVILLNISAAAQSRPLNLGDLKTRLIEYKRSGTYDREVAMLIERAQRYVLARAKSARKPAIVLDIDETSLSNWPQLAANDFGYIPGGACDALPAGPCGVRSWEISARADVIAPTLALFKAARAANVAVF